MSGEKTQESAGWAKHLPKRFYKLVTVEPAEEAHFTISLDGRGLRCPGGSHFRAPLAVARAAAQEWDAVKERIDPSEMPVTKAVNSALEQVAPQRDAVVEEIAGYGGTDLLCYRAVSPEALALREAAAWDPVLEWAAKRYNARLAVGAGVTPVEQKAEAIAALRAAVSEQSDLALTALSDLVALSGSLLLGLAVLEDHLCADAAWAASRIDEDWQIEQWGRDVEAEEVVAAKRQAFDAAARLAALLRDEGA